MSQRTRIALVCPKHGYVKGETCPLCVKEVKGDPIRVNVGDWVTKETWSDVDPKQPNLRVSSKRELIEACDRNGSYAKAFMKPKSQGKGWEPKRRGA